MRRIPFALFLIVCFLPAIAFAMANPVMGLSAVAIGAAIFAWLTSPQGIAFLGGVGAAIWGWIKRKDSRAEKIGKLADELFTVVERIGLIEGLKGNAKWGKFISLMIDAMKAAGLGAPTAKEVENLKQIAYRKAWLAKPVLNGVNKNGLKVAD